MGAPAVDDKPSDTLVEVSGEGFWTGSSTLPHLHQLLARRRAPGVYRQPSSGATNFRMLSTACALYSTPSWFGTVRSSVSAAWIAVSLASSRTSTSGSAAYDRPKIAFVWSSIEPAWSP